MEHNGAGLMGAGRSRDRLASLDSLRGLTILGMILVNSAAGMFYDARASVFPLLLHAHWNGLTIADLVFPAFVTMVGVSIPIALAGAKRSTGLDGGAVRRIGGRTLRLFAIGLLLSNLAWLASFEAHPWRFWGVLQRIALVYGACATLFLATGPRPRLFLIVAILLLYWPLTLLPSPDGLATDIWTRGHNFVGWVDRAMLGSGEHIYVTGPEGYDPEGLLGTLPAIAQGLIGVAVGQYIAGRAPSASRHLALAGAAMLLAGLGWSLAFPIVKDIWSSSFVLVTAGITIVLLAGCHALFDKGNDAKPGWIASVLEAFGVNAIAAYVLHQLTSGVVGWDVTLMPYRLMRGVLPETVASLLPIALYIAAIGWAMVALRRKGWFIKV